MSEPVQFVVLASPATWSGDALRTVGGHSIYAANIDRDVYRVPLTRLVPDDIAPRRMSVPTETMTLKRTAYASGVRVTRRERRASARHGTRGRRSAVSVPFETRCEAHVFAAEGTREPIVIDLLRGLVPITSKVFKRQPIKDVVRRRMKR